MLLLSCSNSVDLNRNYPDPLLLGKDNLGPQGTEEPETLAIMQWTSGTHFVAGASMHEVPLPQTCRVSRSVPRNAHQIPAGLAP